jgi:iron complex outermembrane receptor protein
MEMIQRFLFIAILIFVSSNLSAQILTGKVCDSNGDPLVNANLLLDDGFSGTITNEFGIYEFKEIKKGKHSITASFVGYKSQTQVIQITGNKLLINFSLEPDENLTDEVVVRAKLEKGTSLLKIPTRTQYIDIEEIDEIPAINVSNLFNKVSGVDVISEFGVFSSDVVVSLRGVSGGTQKGTLVILNGSPINKSESGSVNWNMLNKDDIESVEIVKGPGSVLYGSNAMGGIIHIITQTPKSLFKANTSIAYGRYNTLKTSLNVSGRSKSNLFYWKLRGSYNLSDGYVNTPEEIIEENDTIVVPVYFNEKSLGGEIGYRFNEHHQIRLLGSFFDDLHGTGVKIFEDFGAGVEHDTYQSSMMYSAVYNTINAYVNVYYLNENYNRLNEYYSEGEYRLYEVDAVRQDMGTRLWTEWSVNENLELIAGSEIKIGKTYGQDIYYTSTDLVRNSGTMNTLAVFAQLDYTLLNNTLHLVPGIRYDHAFFYDAMFSIQDPSYAIEYLTDFQFSDIENTSWGALNPKFSVEYNFNQNHTVYASVARGFSAPILEDLCRTGRKKVGFKIANPNLKPEYITNFEIGGDALFAKLFHVSLSVYYTLGNDYMYFLSTGDTVNLGYTLAPVYQSQNISLVEILGAEADFQFDVNKAISFYANYTYNHAIIKEFIPQTNADRNLSGKFLTDIPMHKFSFGTTCKTKYANVSLAGKYNGSRWINDDNSTDNVYLFSNKYPAYFLTDIKIWKSLKNITLSIDVENLFNVKYTNSKGYVSPGRFYMFKINYQFKYL